MRQKKRPSSFERACKEDGTDPIVVRVLCIFVIASVIIANIMIYLVDKLADIIIVQ